MLNESSQTQHINYDPIYTKFKDEQNLRLVIKIREVFAGGRDGGIPRGATAELSGAMR